MAARKNPEDRVRRNKVAEPLALPEWDGVRRGFSLQSRDLDRKWHPSTVFWWNQWRDSPQAMFTTDIDWESLYVAAIIHDTIMKGCSHTAMAALTAELGRRESRLGATVEDRVRLGMGNGQKPTKQDAEIKEAVEEIVDYAAMLGKKQNNPGD